MENHLENRFGGGLEVLWGCVLPQIGRIRFRSFAGEVAFPPSCGFSRHEYFLLDYYVGWSSKIRRKTGQFRENYLINYFIHESETKKETMDTLETLPILL